jgi:hypothetical protein
MFAACDCKFESRTSARASLSRRRWSQLALFLLALPFATLMAQQDRPTQYDVEAVYLLNFAKFVRWPQTSGAQRAVSICVLGDESFATILDRTVGGEKVNGQPVIEKRISRTDEASACSILYIGASHAAQAGSVLALLQEQPVLTVSDMPEFLERGGVIQFVVRDNRVRFEVNLEPTTRDGLMLSSELLKVAVKVREVKAPR